MTSFLAFVTEEVDEPRPKIPVGLAKRVLRGVALLDQREPSWAIGMTETLSIQSCYRCVLGQIFGSFHDGRMSLHLDEVEVIDHGFEGSDTRAYVDECAALTRLWAYVIRQRQAVA